MTKTIKYTEAEQEEISSLEEIKNFFLSKNSFEGIELLANSNNKDAVKLLYKFHRCDELSGEEFLKYKKYLSENM